MASDLILPGPGYAGFLHFMCNVPSQPGLIMRRSSAPAGSMAVASDAGKKEVRNESMAAAAAPDDNKRSSPPALKVLVPDESMAVASDAGKKEVPNESMAVAATPDKDKAWFKTYETLKAYHAKHGEFGKKKGSLRSWLERQKKLYKDGQLDSGKVDHLLALGVDLDGASLHGQPANKHKMEEEDAPSTPGGASGRVPQGPPPSMAKRVVKKHYGVVEDPKTWDHNYEILKMYKEEHGTIRVVRGGTKETDALLEWMEKQKEAHSKADLNYNRIVKLRELGMNLK